MDFLIIRTGIPFGYLIFAAIVVVVFILSLVSAILSITSTPVKKLQLTLSLASILFLSLVMWANLSQDDIDLNPLIRGNEPLVGVWQNDDSKLTLLENDMYLCSGELCNAIGSAGHWQRFQDFEIDLKPAAGNVVRWRITENISKNSYQLIDGAVGDPDFWETHVEFTKKIKP